ncbi:MAG: response regulator transcription factor [Chloroflexi bacterium]|nr:response regulator transcription factor [Chloroflexota bacterium]
MSPIRILLAEDHEMVRDGLKALLSNEDDFIVVAEAEDGEDAVQKAMDYEPHVVIMDIRMPGAMSGIDACEAIMRKRPDTKILMLTSYAEDELVKEAIRAGAVGYVLKRAGSKKLISDIRAIAAGDAVLDASVTRTLLEEVREAANMKEASAFADLSQREMQILALISDGLTNREIAQKLYLGEGTVRNYVGNILSTLQASNRAEAAVFAVKHHIERYVDWDSEE